MINRCILFSLILLSITSSRASSGKARGARTSSNPVSRPVRVSITDDRPRKISVPRPLRRIISLSPVTTEYLYAAGLGERVVGVTSYCKFPPQVSRKRKVGGVTNPSLEVIVALKPDLVVASKLTPMETIERIERLGIPVFGTNPTGIDRILRTIETLGQLGGTQSQAAAFTKPLRERVQLIARKMESLKPSHRPRVFYVLDCDPLFTAGRGSLVDEIIRLAGGDNVAGDLPQPWGNFSMETLVARNPDVIIFSGQSASDSLRKAAQSERAWQLLNAVKKDRVTAFSTDFIGNPSPRAVEGLWKLARYLHPEIFRARVKERPTGDDG